MKLHLKQFYFALLLMSSLRLKLAVNLSQAVAKAVYIEVLYVKND